MKKRSYLLPALALTAAICGTTSLTAQTQKGKWLAEGNIGNLNFSNNKSETTYNGLTSRYQTNAWGVGVMPRAGYFVIDRLNIGASLQVYGSGSKSKSWSQYGELQTDGTSSSFSVGIAPYARYYFAGNASRNKLYAQVGGGVNLAPVNKSTSTYYNGPTKVTSTYKAPDYIGYNGDALLGFNHFFTESLAFNTALGYRFEQSRQKEKGLNGTDRKSISTYHRISWNFGFTFIL